MPTSRERVRKALNFRISDRLPKDLGGMRSTGISACTYPDLVAALGLPPRRPKTEDTMQMLALPDLDVIDELHGGQPLDLSANLPKFDLKQYKHVLAKLAPTDEKIIALTDLCQRVRESTDQAVFFNDGTLQSPIGIGSFGITGIYPILCLTEASWVAELHKIITIYRAASTS